MFYAPGVGLELMIWDTGWNAEDGLDRLFYSLNNYNFLAIESAGRLCGDYWLQVDLAKSEE